MTDVSKRFADVDFRDEVRKVLTADMVYRRDKKWPLKTMDVILVNSVLGQEFVPSFPEHFTGLATILEKYRGKLTLCGGLVTRMFFLQELDLDGSLDADLFFHNVTKEEADQILEECIISLVSLKRPETHSVRIERRKFVTNVVIQFERAARWSGSLTRIFQFIHRIYPSLDSVLGGFDIPYGMLAYDGERIVGTPIAEWCLKNRCHIVDTTRRSLSYENRIIKYKNKFPMAVFFPGLTYDWLAKILSKQEIETIANHIAGLLKESGLAFIDDDNKPIPNSNIKYRLDSIESQNIRQCGRLHVYKGTKTNYTRQTVFGKEHEIRNLKAYSDYSSCEIVSDTIPYANSTMIRCGNFEGVIVAIQFEEGEQITYQRARECYRELVESPDVKTIPLESLSHYGTRMRVSRLGTFWNQYRNVNLRDKLVRAQIREVLNEYVRTEAHRLDEWLKGNQWITENPGRQWTASFNPIMEDPREFYGVNYVPFHVGIPNEIESTLRLGLKDKGSNLYTLPKDVFNMLLRYILRNYM